MEGEAKIPEGFAAMAAGEIIPEGSLWSSGSGQWCKASSATIGKAYDPRLPQDGPTVTKHAPHIKQIKLNPGDGYRLLEEGDLFPHGYEYLSAYNGEWELGGLVGNRYQSKTHGTCRAKIPDMPAPKDPKTKYHRPMYPAWNDTEVHTDANGHQYINVDVYSVLAAFDPGHEVAHAVKKLLAAGTRDKGSKIQDYREAIISIEAAIYRAEIEGGAG